MCYNTCHLGSDLVPPNCAIAGFCVAGHEKIFLYNVSMLCCYIYCDSLGVNIKFEAMQ